MSAMDRSGERHRDSARAPGRGFRACACTYPARLVVLALASSGAFGQTVDWSHFLSRGTPDPAVATEGTSVYAAHGVYKGIFSGYDIALHKFDATGKELWMQQFTLATVEGVDALAADSTGVYLLGALQDPNLRMNSFIRKYDPKGVVLWTRQFTEADLFAYAVALDRTGVYMAGIVSGHAFLRKLDLNGTTLWTQQATESSGATSVAVDGSGIYIVGKLGGPPFPPINQPFGKAFIRKYDLFGTEQWTRQLDSRFNDDEATGVASEASGIYMTGYSRGLTGFRSSTGMDAYLVKYDFLGNQVWAQEFGSSVGDGNVYGRAIATDAGGVYVLGDPGPLAGQAIPGFFVRKYTPSGQAQWTTQLGTVSDRAVAIASSALGVYTVHHTPHQITPGTAQFDYDSTLTKFSPGAGCGYSISPPSQSFPPTGGSGTVSVTATGACPWTAVASANFVSVTAGANGSGGGLVSYAMAANTGLQPRSATLSIAGYLVQIAQGGNPTAPVIAQGGVLNNASFVKNARLSPGSIAAVFGSNLNDGSSVLFTALGADGKVVTTLGGASVKVNNISAPLLYSTPGQLGIQIPLEIANGSSPTVQVTVGGLVSEPSTIQIDNYAPGIFTTTQDGKGPAVALHQDGISVVTSDRPAKPNEIVALFATGLGIVTPALSTGVPSSGNRVLSPIVTIDGARADVLFAGMAPGFVGLYQVNARIPPATRSAPSLPIVFDYGGRVSNTASIAVGP